MSDLNALVLGESKMFGPFMDKGSIIRGIRVPKRGLDALADDIRKHFTVDYAKRHFLFIEKKTILEDRLDLKQKIADPMRAKIRAWREKLRSASKLDDVFESIYVPLLCTYSSSMYADHKQAYEAFLKAYEAEMRELESYFNNKNILIPNCLNIIIMLFPVPCKDQLIEEYYQRIKTGANQQ